MPVLMITQVGAITDGPKPQMGPDSEVPFTIEINGGRDFLELSPKVAIKLSNALHDALLARMV